MSAGAQLRIAAHISAREWGGAERRSLALLAGLAARGHNVVVYCNTDRIAEKTREHGLTAVIRPLGGDIMAGHAFAFAAALRRQRPDVLILVTFRRLWLGAFAARLAGVPRTISRIGTSTDVARSAKYRFVLKHWIDDVVFNAHSMREPFIRSLPAGASVRFTVIPNGVAALPAAFTRAEARSALGLPDDAFVIGTVSRLAAGKGMERMLDATALLDESTWAVITGDGALRATLEARAEELRIAHRVRFTGARDDVGNVLAALDLYLVSSDREGMSNAMLEALAAGLPVVSTPVSGAAEALLRDPVCGVVTTYDAADIAGAVAALRDDPKRRAQLASSAKHVARARYSLDAMIDAWEELLLDRR
ncbi:MAG TPA: glycosyltransferase [Longimicrobiales bacterium]|nr:glycosyltransferase [Longimicrobiales bacterium]